MSPRLKVVNGPKPAAKLDDLVGYFIAVRDEIDKIEAQHDKVLKPLKEMKAELTSRLLGALAAEGVEMARTDKGTVTASTRYSAKLVDPDGFMDFVMEHGQYELLERRANATACREYADEHDELPPGVTINSIRIIHVRS